MSKELLHYYPLANPGQKNIYQTRFLTNDEISLIVNQMGFGHPLMFSQEEAYYRDLVCITINNKPMYYKKKTFLDQQIKNGIIIKTFLDPIDENMFPQLSQYNHTEHKQISLYKMKSINILIITYGPDKNVICVEFKFYNIKVPEFDKIIALLERIDAPIHKLNNIPQPFLSRTNIIAKMTGRSH